MKTEVMGSEQFLCYSAPRETQNYVFWDVLDRVAWIRADESRQIV